MTSLRDRIDRVAQKGSLSTADIALWLGLPYATVRSYRLSDITPNEARRQQIEQRLHLLEAAVRGDQRLPVPLHVRARDRKEYLGVILRDATRKRK